MRSQAMTEVQVDFGLRNFLLGNFWIAKGLAALSLVSEVGEEDQVCLLQLYTSHSIVDSAMQPGRALKDPCG